MCYTRYGFKGLCNYFGGLFMRFNDGTLTCVLNGDWNKKYIDPQWISKELFQKDELEVTLNTIGLKTNIIYKSGLISIDASQDKFVFLADDYSENSIKEIETTIIRFLDIASTPGVVSFGFNCELSSDDISIFSSFIEEMGDRKILTDLGAEIKNTEISHTISIDDVTINIKEALDSSNDVFTISFNQHHDVLDYDKNIISFGNINEFLERCKSIVQSIGYELEEV